jgi:CCR4-NOT transcriptional regulation complex NOT5 subunit
MKKLKNEDPDPDRIQHVREEEATYVAEGEEDDEDLEEANGMAGGDIQVASGPSGNQPPGAAEDEYLIREDDEELVENIVNYLNNGAGVL